LRDGLVTWVKSLNQLPDYPITQLPDCLIA
jgi:hypothetical protein